ncbi:hypothetical protein [Caminibacter sp.]
MGVEITLEEIEERLRENGINKISEGKGENHVSKNLKEFLLKCATGKVDDILSEEEIKFIKELENEELR